ncbi:MAG TPA: hypothetical protein VGF65_19925, partial [Mycobacterium sp.]
WPLGLASAQAEARHSNENRGAHSAWDRNQNTAVARSVVDVVVRRGDLGERVRGCDGDPQRTGSGGRNQIIDGLLLGFSGEVIAA